MCFCIGLVCIFLFYDSLNYFGFVLSKFFLFDLVYPD